MTKNFYETYENVRASLIQTDQSISTAIPKWIYENRYGRNFWGFIKGVSPNYQGRRDFIDMTFQICTTLLKRGSQPARINFFRGNQLCYKE